MNFQENYLIKKPLIMPDINQEVYHLLPIPSKNPINANNIFLKNETYLPMPNSSTMYKLLASVKRHKKEHANLQIKESLQEKGH